MPKKRKSQLDVIEHVARGVHIERDEPAGASVVLWRLAQVDDPTPRSEPRVISLPADE